MTKKRILKENSSLPSTPSKISWQKRRAMLSKSIPLEVDLESRQLFFSEPIDSKLNFKTENLDAVIESLLLPKESKKVRQSLLKAKRGLEKPIPFQFIHPLTSKSFHFEYHYRIVYVKYSSTRLQGELVKTTRRSLKR